MGDAETRRGSVKSEIIEDASAKETLAPPPPSSPDEPVASTTRASPGSEAEVRRQTNRRRGGGAGGGGSGGKRIRSTVSAAARRRVATATPGSTIHRRTPSPATRRRQPRSRTREDKGKRRRRERAGKRDADELATTEAAFARFNRVRRQDERLRAACEPCFGAAFERHAKLYEEQSRVLVLEGRWDNGLGNNMERWRSLFSLASPPGGRCTLTRGDAGTGTGRPDGGEDCHFDPGHYFTGDGFDWRWHPAREKEFDELLGRETPMRTFHHMCRKDHENAHRRPCQLMAHGWPSNAESAKIQPNAVAHNGYEEDPGGGEPRQNDAWLHEWLNSDEVLGWRYVKLKLRTPYDLQNEAAASEVHDYGACEIDGEKVEDEVSLARKCRAQHFFRPTRALMRGAAPVLRQMDAWAGVAAIHIRTGFADWQEYWLTEVKPKDSTEIAAMEGKYSCDPTAIVRNLGAVFRQCNGRYDEQVCTNWWNLPTESRGSRGILRGVRRPRTRSWDAATSLPSGTRGAARSRTRARSRRRLRARLASRRLPRRGRLSRMGRLRPRGFPRGRQGARQDPVAEGPRRVSARRRRRGGDVQTGAVRRRGLRRRRSFARRGAAGEDKVGEDKEDDDEEEGNRAWMRAVVDMYVASLADADVQLPGSSFMSAGALGLSVTNVRPNALGFGGEVVMDQMVTPIGETKERSAGFHENYENYVLLSASHCEFDDERGGGGV